MCKTKAICTFLDHGDRREHNITTGLFGCALISRTTYPNTDALQEREVTHVMAEKIPRYIVITCDI